MRYPPSPPRTPDRDVANKIFRRSPSPFPTPAAAAAEAGGDPSEIIYILPFGDRLLESLLVTLLAGSLYFTLRLNTISGIDALGRITLISWLVCGCAAFAMEWGQEHVTYWLHNAAVLAVWARCEEADVGTIEEDGDEEFEDAETVVASDISSPVRLGQVMIEREDSGYMSDGT
ncbi:hypothetical protein HK101_006266, partial [Irineochytrium annulatum]